MNRAKKFGYTLFSVVFTGIMLAYAAANAYQAAGAVRITADRERGGNPAALIGGLSGTMTDSLLWKDRMTEGYGAILKALGKQEEGGFDNVRDRSGYLFRGNFWSGYGEDQQELAIRMRRLMDGLAAEHTQVGFVLAPSKGARDAMQYSGIPYDSSQREADDILRWLDYYGVPYLDLRSSLEQSGLTYEDTWFKTDRHWKPEAAFEGYRAMVGWINEEYGANLDEDGAGRDKGNYETVTYPAAMLGSQGRDGGILYSGGMEDYRAVIPKKQGSYTWIDENNKKRSGTFRQAFLKEDIGGLNPYELNAGRFYLNELTDYDRLQNEELPDGARILLLRDSFATPVGAFLAQNCAQVDMLWSQDYSPGEVMSRLESETYDYVFVMLYPGSLSQDNFPFYESEQE